jgi:hypothetical protein
MGPNKLWFLNPGLLEVRFLGKHQTWAIFTSDRALVESALQQPKVAGLDAYQTLNPPRPDTPVRHGVCTGVLFQAARGQLSADVNIQRRTWLLFDSDAIRQTGTAATEEQRQAAHAHSRGLEAALTAEGWPLPLACCSGNGAHRLYRVDLPNDPSTASLVSNLLHVMGRRLDNDAVQLDKTVSNAARITRLYGARNQKAGRDSAVLSAPDPIVTVSLEQINAVLSKWRSELGYKKPLVTRPGGWSLERVESFLDFYSIDYRPPVEIPAGLLWVLTPCPLNEKHTGSSPAVILTKMGWPKFRCMHNSCSGIRWADFCKRLHRITGEWFVYAT